MATTNTSTAAPVRSEQLSLAFVVVLELIRVVESILAIAGNGVTIACIIRYRRLRLPTNYLVGSLALADLISGVNHLVFLDLVFTDDPQAWRVQCLANQTVAIIVTASNIVHIAVISVDRYLAVSQPTSYKHRVTKHRVLICVIIIWSCIMTVYIPVMITGSQELTGYEDICSYLTILPSQTFSITALPLVCVTTLVALTSYSLIFCRLRRHTRRMSQTMEASNPRQSVTHETIEQSATRAMVLVMLSFAISTLPPVIYTVVVDEDDPLRPYVFRIVIALWYVSSFINPFIYAWKNQRYREAFRHMLTRKGEGPRSQGIHSPSIRA